MHNIKSSNMLLPVHNNTSSAHVTSTSDHHNVTGVEFDIVGDFSLLKIELHGVVDLDDGIGITDSAAVVSDDVGDASCTNGNSSNLQQLVGSLLGGDAMDGESALDIIQETEVLA